MNSSLKQTHLFAIASSVKSTVQQNRTRRKVLEPARLLSDETHLPFQGSEGGNADVIDEYDPRLARGHQVKSVISSK